MGKGIRYSDEFKQEAVNQVAIHGYAVNDVAERLGISSKTWYSCLKTFSKPTSKRKEEVDLRAEIARLKRELKRRHSFGCHQSCPQTYAITKTTKAPRYFLH